MPQILKLDAHGQPSKWISWQDAATYHAKNQVSWSLGEIAMVIHGGNNRDTGEQSIITTSSIIAVKGEAKGRKLHRPPALNNTELFRRDRHVCAYCGGHFAGKMTRDHIVPTSKGGVDTWMNCVSACSRCNQKKDDRTLQECGMTLLYVPYVPSRAEHLILQNRAILGDQMDFLLSFVPDGSRVKAEYLKH
jgi:5-methylcytosine-specific restriction endonuclease McrA